MHYSRKIDIPFRWLTTKFQEVNYWNSLHPYNLKHYKEGFTRAPISTLWIMPKLIQRSISHFKLTDCRKPPSFSYILSQLHLVWSMNLFKHQPPHAPPNFDPTFSIYKASLSCWYYQNHFPKTWYQQFTNSKPSHEDRHTYLCLIHLRNLNLSPSPLHKKSCSNFSTHLDTFVGSEDEDKNVIKLDRVL